MANKLAYYLRRTASRDVIVKKAQVVELVGEKKAEDLCTYSVSKSEIRVGRVGRRSAIAPSKRVDTAGLAHYNRMALLEAIEEAQGVGFQVDSTDSCIKTYNPLPSPSLVPKDSELGMRLAAKGYEEFQEDDE